MGWSAFIVSSALVFAIAFGMAFLVFGKNDEQPESLQKMEKAIHTPQGRVEFFNYRAKNFNCLIATNSVNRMVHLAHVQCK